MCGCRSVFNRNSKKFFMKMLTKRLSIQATNTMPWSQLGLREDVVDLWGENGQTCTGQAGGLHKMVSA